MRPFSDLKANIIHSIEEIAVLLATFLFMFICADSNVKEMGKAAISIISGAVFFTMIIEVTDLFRNICRRRKTSETQIHVL